MLVVIILIKTTTKYKEMGGEFGFLGEKGNAVYLKANWNLIYICDLFDYSLLGGKG